MLSVLYVPCPADDEAERLSKALIDEDLAACTNLIETTSFYVWDGELAEDDEVVMLVKTSPDLIDEVVDWLLAEHPYDTPCIMDLGVAGINESYGRWVDGQTRAGETGESGIESQGS